MIFKISDAISGLFSFNFFTLQGYYIAHFMRFQVFIARFMRFVCLHKFEVIFLVMFNTEDIVKRIKELSKEKGHSLTFIYKQLDLPGGYLRDVNAGKTSLTDERINRIANFFGTTPEYLKGETDVKEKVTANGDDLSDKEMEMLKVFRSLTDEEQELFLKMFSSSQK